MLKTKTSNRQGRRRRWLTRSAVVAVVASAASIVFTAPASAQWKNCGDYICTKYYTKAETQQLHRDFQDHEAATSGGVVGVLCGLLPVEDCGLGFDAYYSQLKQSTALAAGIDGCLKVESSTDPNQTWVRAGVTTDPNWCLTHDPVYTVPDQAYWG